MKRVLRKTFSFQWWQLGLYELALFSLGAGIAGLFPSTFQNLWHIFLLAFVVIAPYILYVYLSQLPPQSDITSGSSNHPDTESDS